MTYRPMKLELYANSYILCFSLNDVEEGVTC